jgi:hypothetical protein
METLKARVAEYELQHDKMKQINRMYRRGDVAGLEAIGLDLAELRMRLEDSLPYSDAEMASVRQRVNHDRHQLTALQAELSRHAAAQRSPIGATIEPWGDDDVRITFADEPERAVLQELRRAGFFFCAGSWAGRKTELPPRLTPLLQAI